MSTNNTYTKIDFKYYVEKHKRVLEPLTPEQQEVWNRITTKQTEVICTSRPVLLDINFAYHLLLKQISNRALIQKNLTTLKQSVIESKFIVNGDTLCFSYHGHFYDGQHRVISVLETGIPIKVLIVTGLEEAAMVTIDKGKARTFADTLSFVHGPDKALVSQLVKMLHFETTRSIRMYSKAGPVRPEHETPLMLFFENNRTRIIDLIEKNKRFGKKSSKFRVSVPLMSYLYDKLKSCENYKQITINDIYKIEPVDYLFDRLYDGSNLDSSSPILEARNDIISINKQHPRNTQYDQIITIVYKAWNAIVQNKKYIKSKCYADPIQL